MGEGGPIGGHKSTVEDLRGDTTSKTKTAVLAQVTAKEIYRRRRTHTANVMGSPY